MSITAPNFWLLGDNITPALNKLSAGKIVSEIILFKRSDAKKKKQFVWMFPKPLPPMFLTLFLSQRFYPLIVSFKGNNDFRLFLRFY